MKFKTSVCLTLLVLLGMGGATFGQQYVGDQACKTCHEDFPTAGFFEGYMNSGHPWKLFRTGGLTPESDTWPGTLPPPLPTVGGQPLEWWMVNYVIGNYFWKARFVDLDGYIWTGDATDKTQWNLATREFVPYHAGEVDKPYDCGRCHTTGYDPEGHQEGLPGLIGTWTEDGIRCEACHGPGSSHATSPIGNPPPGGKDCSECHYRDSEFRMPWRGGFTRHHQQAEDLSHSPHTTLSCETCHNPHRSTVYKDGGTITQCTDCHPGDGSNNNYVVAGMESIDCIDCHMPFMGKSATASNAYTGDIRGHLFSVMTEPIAAADNVYDVGGNLFWNQDDTGQSAATLDYACLGCHETMTLEEASAFAQSVHQPVAPVGDIWTLRSPFAFEPITLKLEPFAGILVVEITQPDGSTSMAIGMETSGVIFWMDVTGAIYFGNIDRTAGIMSGVAFGGPGIGGIWFAEQL